MPNRKLPPDDEVKKEYINGASLLQIAVKYGVSHGAVWQALQRKGVEGREERSGYMPPNLKIEHRHTPAANRLRWLARSERAERGGRPLGEDEARRLKEFLDLLAERDWVVHYDPDYVSPADGSNSASPTKGGWWYGPRPDGVPRGSITAYDPIP